MSNVLLPREWRRARGRVYLKAGTTRKNRSNLCARARAHARIFFPLYPCAFREMRCPSLFLVFPSPPPPFAASPSPLLLVANFARRESLTPFFRISLPRVDSPLYARAPAVVFSFVRAHNARYARFITGEISRRVKSTPSSARGAKERARG